MSRRKVIVKRLNAIQNFGAMDVLCTDKTGTLTQDRVILQKALDLLGQESHEVLEYAYLNSYYQSGLKNLLDVAVLRHAEAPTLLKSAHEFQKLDEVPFDFERRRMSVALQGGGAACSSAKAPWKRCSQRALRGAPARNRFLSARHIGRSCIVRSMISTPMVSAS